MVMFKEHFEFLNKEAFNKVFKNLSIISIKTFNDSTKSKKHVQIILEEE